MGAYSKDLRSKVLAAVDRGVPLTEALEMFGVSLATLKRWLKRRKEGGDLSPRSSTGRKRRILATSEEKRALCKQLEENDEATLERHCELWEKERGVRVSLATMSRAIRQRLGWTRKRSLGATERDEEKRSAWRERLRSVDPSRLVFVDECSTFRCHGPKVRQSPKRREGLW
jgi:transposase